METGDHLEEEVVDSGGSSGSGPVADPPPDSAAEQDTSPADMLRFDTHPLTQMHHATERLSTLTFNL